MTLPSCPAPSYPTSKRGPLLLSPLFSQDGWLPLEKERERKRMRRGLFLLLPLLPPPPRFSYSNGGAAFSHKKFFPVSLPPSFFGEGDKFSFLHPALEKKACLDSVWPWN